MPLVSVKIPEETKQRVARLAAAHGTTAHALMVQAIESAAEGAEQYDSFIEDAKARGEKVAKPRLKSLKTILKRA
jgi:predicted transcriptional regulator